MNHSILTSTSLGLNIGISPLNAGFLQAIETLMDLNGVSYYSSKGRPEEWRDCCAGLLSIKNPTLFQNSAMIKKILNGRSCSASSDDVRREIEQAFEMPNVTMRLPAKRRMINDAVDRIIATARSHEGIMMLLALMKEQLGSHYYHGLRSGVIHCCFCEYFDPVNTLFEGTMVLVGVVHDAGKLEVPGNILFKSGRLDPKEQKIMQRHNDATRRILTPFQREFSELADVAVYHHNYPRTGSERRLNDRRQRRKWVVYECRDGLDRRCGRRRRPLPDTERCGILLRMVDSYDALASERDYKPAYPVSETQRIMLSNFPYYSELVDYLLKNFPCPAC